MPPAALTAGEPNVAFSPLVNYSGFPSAFELTPAFGFGANLSFRLSRGLQLILSASTTSTEQRYDGVGGARSLPVQATQLGLLAEATVAEIGGLARFSLLGGGGVLRMTTDEQRVPLGALGEAVVPARTDTYPTGTVGAAVTGALLPGLALRLEPHLNLVSAEGSLRGAMSINAGVSLGLF